MKIVLLTGLMVLSCTALQPKDVERVMVHTDSPLLNYEAYVLLFINEAASRGIDLDASLSVFQGVKIETLPEGAYGVCRTEEKPGGTNTVIILDPKVATLINKAQKLIIYHELFHCLTYLLHEDVEGSLLSRSLDSSIMERSTEDLINEQFDRVRKEALE